LNSDTYWRPNAHKCCPTSRITSLSESDKLLIIDALLLLCRSVSLKSPLATALAFDVVGPSFKGSVPFSAHPPLSTDVCDCIVSLCRFKGGGDKPPCSVSDDDASLFRQKLLEVSSQWRWTTPATTSIDNFPFANPEHNRKTSSYWKAMTLRKRALLARGSKC